MINHQPFIDQILCHPDDDGPRLVYADFLEEHGEPERAEFIRVQCSLARLGEHPPGQHNPHHDYKECKWCRLLRRERELGEKFSCKWLPSEWCNEKGELLFPGIFKLDFHRGFVEIVEATAYAWLQHGKQIVRRQPIRKVRLMETTVLPTDAARAWRLFLQNSGTLRQDWEKAALLWARQEPCPKCSRKPFQKLVKTIGPYGIEVNCPQCSGKGSVDFRTLKETKQ